MGKKRGNWRKDTFRTTQRRTILSETCPSRDPSERASHGLGGGSEGAAGRFCLSPGASRAIQGQQAPATRARGPRGIHSPTPNPARFLAPWASAAGPDGLPAAAPAGLAPPRPATSPPPAGPPRGCASRKLPAPRGPLPASAPPPRVPKRCVIGPPAPSLSGRVTALVSERPETGSGISARGAAVEGSVQPCLLPLARGSAR